ncbi:MAG: RHS repeat-associated core domain-containing protein [Pirellulales bacterium]
MFNGLLNEDSEVLTLPEDGSYVLEAYATGAGAGGYAFRLDTVTVNSLELGVPHTGMLTGSGHAQWFSVEVTQGNPLQVDLDSLVDTSQVEVFVRQGILPTRRDFDYQSSDIGSDHPLTLPFATPGTWYILVYGDALLQPNEFTLGVVSTAVALTSLSPVQYSAGQLVSLSIQGAGFLPGSQVELIAADGTSHAAHSVSVDAFDRLTARFDLSGIPQALYDVRVSTPHGSSATLTAAFEVLPTGAAKLETKLILPGALGRAATSTVYVEYSNTGTAAMPAPILILQSTDDRIRPKFTLDGTRLAKGLWTSGSPDGFSDSVQIYASGKTPGLLLPGEKFQVPVYYAGLQQPWDFSINEVELEIRIHQAGSTAILDWQEMYTSLRPSWLTAEAWNAVFANLLSQIGSTWGDYVEMLSENASFLGRLGPRVIQVDDLYSFELRQAIGLTPVSLLAAAVDAALVTPGLPVEFGRSFGNTITTRFELGAFGRGWSVPWQFSLVELEDNTVVVQESSGNQRRFQPDSRRAGAFFSSQGDTGVLRRINVDGTTEGVRFELTETNGLVTRFHADGRLDYIQDINANRITAGHTVQQLTSLTHSSGASLTLTYSDTGRISSITDSAGRSTTYQYDAANEHLLAVTGPAGTTSYTYSIGEGPASEHALLSITQPDGATRLFEYDDRGRLNASYLGEGIERLEYHYDETGQVTSTDAAGASSHFFFDHRGLVLRSEDGQGTYFRYEYNDAGQLIRQIDSLGRSQSYTWCGCGALISVTDEAGHTTRFTKGGPNNQPLAFTDARGNATRYTYDAAGNLTNKIYADGSVETVLYDAAGNPTSIVNRRGETIDLLYDASGRVTHETNPDGSTVTYVYDGRDRLVIVVDGQGMTSFTYDEADRLTRVEYPSGRWLAYEYDAAGRRTRMEDHSGHATEYAYDTVGRLVSLHDGVDQLIVSYTYDTVGRVSREDKGNGTYTLYGYDVIGRLISVDHHTPDGSLNAYFEYEYNALGQRVAMQTLDGQWTYTYDLTGQLIRAVFVSSNSAIPDQDLSYEYDAVGNRIRTVINGVTSEYSANSLNQYTTARATTYQYDLDGNLTEETGPNGTRVYTYNVRNQLVVVVTPEGSWQYEYDAFGNRVASVVNGERTEYLLDPTGMVDVVAEYDAANNRTMTYAHGLGLEAAAGAESWMYYDFDAIGSTAGLTGAAGAYANHYAYDPFGGTLLRTETVANPFEFVGAFGVMAESNGLHFMRARYYRAELGRFASEDAVGLLSNDTNLYRYASNNPLAYIDPSGFTSSSYQDAWRQQAEEARLCRNGCIKPEPTAAEKEFDRRFRGNRNDLRHDSSDFLKAITFPVDIVNLAKNIITKLPQVLKFFPALVPLLIPSDEADKGDSKVVQSVDPNEKFGAAGYGTGGFIDADTLIPYRVHFENLGPGSIPAPTQPATAPAQRVEITDQLSEHLDWSSLRFTEFGFGDSVLFVPDGRQYYFTTLSMTYNDQTFDVEVELDFDSLNGRVRVVFQSIDPDTFLPPDILTGFLPPEDGTGIGKGHIGFTVMPKAGLPSGTAIRNVALISFDGQTIIATNQIDPQNPAAGTDPAKEALNTIDAAEPTSSVSALPSESQQIFTVSWTGADDAGGSGISSFDVFVSVDDGDFTLWLNDTADHSREFVGELGRTYAFYTVSVDNVGHLESTPAMADATTFTVAPADAASPAVAAVVVQNGLIQRSYVDQIRIEFTEWVNLAELIANGTITSAMTLTNRGVDVAGDTDEEVPLTAGQLRYEFDEQAGISRLIWSLDGFAGMFDSLADGFYEFVLNAQLITDLAGSQLDGNGDGTGGDSYVVSFHRLQGDGDGNNVVDALDLQLVNDALGSHPALATWNANADLDRDGRITVRDRLVAVRSAGQQIVHDTDPVVSAVFLPGDFNADGIVDAADYTVWRDNLNRSDASPFEGDATWDRVVDDADRAEWNEHFGKSLEQIVSADVSLFDDDAGDQTAGAVSMALEDLSIASGHKVSAIDAAFEGSHFEEDGIHFDIPRQRGGRSTWKLASGATTHMAPVARTDAIDLCLLDLLGSGHGFKANRVEYPAAVEDELTNAIDALFGNDDELRGPLRPFRSLGNHLDLASMAKCELKQVMKVK